MAERDAPLSQINVLELAKGFRRNVSSNARQEVHFLSVGTDDEDESYLAVLGYLPLTVSAGAPGFLLPLDSLEGEWVGAGLWHYVAIWGTNSSSPGQKENVQFDTGGASVKITQSVQTSNAYSAKGANGSDIPPNNGAIGVSDDGTVEGVEVPAPVQRWNETHFLPKALLTPTWWGNVTLLSQRTNIASFRGYDVDQVKFDHVSGSVSGEDPTPVTFFFEAAPHVYGITCGQITGITKKAWEYLWVKYQKQTVNFHLVSVPQYVYCEQIFYQGDFSALLIPQGAWLPSTP